MASSGLLWETLARREASVVTSDELARLALKVGLDARNATDNLVRTRKLAPLFKGTYYVRRPDEVLLGVERATPLDLFRLGADAKGIGHWYFALHTALRLHGLTHEYRTTHEVVSEKLHRPGGLDIGGARFVIHKWHPKLFGWGVTRVRGLPVSDPERTVLDLAYRDYWAERRGGAATREWKEYTDKVDAKRLMRWSSRFPKPFRDWMRAS